MQRGTMLFTRFFMLFVTLVAGISVALALGASLTDAARYQAGYVGLALVLAGQVYYVRRKWPRVFPFGSLRGWLVWHRSLTAIGAFLVFVHAGDGEVPRGVAALSLLFMLATALSGMTGSYIFRQWRKVHAPITATFFMFAVLHVFAMILFGGVVDRG